MEAALKLIPARTELLMVAGAGHELMTPRNRAELVERVVERFLQFAKGWQDGTSATTRSATQPSER